jgi:hypothetical protein
VDALVFIWSVCLDRLQLDNTVETPPTQGAITITASHASVLPAPLKTDRDLLPVERVPRIVNFPNLGLMSFVLMICTTS